LGEGEKSVKRQWSGGQNKQRSSVLSIAVS